MNGTFTSAELNRPPEEVTDDHFLLSLEIDPPVDTKPGQFVNIRPGTGTDPLVRRPFSIFSRKDTLIEILVSVIGPGTRLITRFTPGPVDAIGPLGKGFTLVTDSRVLIAGGGVGNAPLHYLAGELKKRNNHITWVFGARSKNYLFALDRISSVCDRLVTATDDGTAGEQGFASDIAEHLIAESQFDMIYTCGPTPMMEQVAALAEKTPVEVSVENYFGCGIGLCAGCTIETVSGGKKACIQGPVFDGKKIRWESLRKEPGVPFSSRQ